MKYICFIFNVFIRRMHVRKRKKEKRVALVRERTE